MAKPEMSKIKKITKASTMGDEESGDFHNMWSLKARVGEFWNYGLVELFIVIVDDSMDWRCEMQVFMNKHETSPVANLMSPLRHVWPGWV